MIKEKIKAIKLAVKYLAKGRNKSIRLLASHVLTCKVVNTLQGAYLVRFDKWTKRQRKTLVESI